MAIEDVCQDRIDIAVLKAESVEQATALRLAHENTLAWTGFEITFAALIFSIIMGFYNKGRK